MLEPIFYSQLKIITAEEGGDFTVAIETNPQSDPPFKVTGYSRSGIYTLVQWEISDGTEGITGENLWRGQTAIAVSGGSLDFYSIESLPQQSQTQRFPTSTWELIPEQIGKYGVPVEVGIALRKPENLIKL